MYPQSLQTHSPSQYKSAFACSSAFWAAVFLFPKTFKLVDEEAMVLTFATGATGLKAVARFVDAKSMSREQTNFIREFMVILFYVVSSLVGYTS
jgi:hypothetical protein